MKGRGSGGAHLPGHRHAAPGQRHDDWVRARDLWHRSQRRAQLPPRFDPVGEGLDALRPVVLPAVHDAVEMPLVPGAVLLHLLVS
jgi:hypothetical protein